MLLKTDGLSHLFLSTAEDTENQLIRFEDKTQLSNSSFRILAEEIRECRSVSDKIVLLNRESLSMKDLVDLLEGDCFFQEEYFAVFQSMEEIRMALPYKTAPS